MDTQLDQNVFYINKIFFYLLAIFIIVIIVGFSYFYIQYKNAQKLSKQPAAVLQDKPSNIVASVESLIELPKNENPTIATVSDREKLRNQPFFANAQNGDKVLIFTKAKKAILYRPSTNKIIEVSLLNFGTTSTPAATITSIAVATPTPTSVLSSTPTMPKGPNLRQ